MRTKKLHNRLQTLMGVAIGLLAVNTVLLLVAVVQLSNLPEQLAEFGPPPDFDGQDYDPWAGSAPPSSGSFEATSTSKRSNAASGSIPLTADLLAAGDPMGTFFASTIDPLVMAAHDHGEDVSPFLPSSDEVQAAIESGDMESPAASGVMERLKSGYDHFRMPFPKNMMAPAPTSEPEAGGAEPPQGPTKTVTQDTPHAGPSDTTVQRDILRAYFTVTSDRLKRAASASGGDTSPYLPSQALIGRAVDSGDIASQPCQEALNMLRKGYEAYELVFPEPMLGSHG